MINMINTTVIIMGLQVQEQKREADRVLDGRPDRPQVLHAHASNYTVFARDSIYAKRAYAIAIPSVRTLSPLY